MAETAPAPALEEPQVTVDLSKITDEDSAAEQLQGLFEDEDAPAGDDDSQPPAGKGAEPGTAPSTDDDTVQVEQAPPAIEAPVSWTAEDKALYAKLPPEVQQTVLRRESERDRVTSERVQKATEQAQRLDAAYSAVANERAQAMQALHGVLFQVQPEIAEFQKVDWIKLAQENPAQWAAQQARLQDLQNRSNLAQQSIATLQQQQQADTEKRMGAKRLEEDQRILEKLPEFRDPAKAQAFVRDVAKYFETMGYAPAEIPQLGSWMSTDHRLVLMARKAMLYDRAQAARTEAATKRVAPPASNVRPLRPAARPAGGARDDASQAELTALHGNLAKTGSTQAAADLLLALGAVK